MSISRRSRAMRSLAGRVRQEVAEWLTQAYVRVYTESFSGVAVSRHRSIFLRCSTAAVSEKCRPSTESCVDNVCRFTYAFHITSPQRTAPRGSTLRRSASKCANWIWLSSSAAERKLALGKAFSAQANHLTYFQEQVKRPSESPVKRRSPYTRCSLCTSGRCSTSPAKTNQREMDTDVSR